MLAQRKSEGFRLATPLETFFQSLENRRKIFPTIGKTDPNFPTIGKIFSNHWKTSDFPPSRWITPQSGRDRAPLCVYSKELWRDADRWPT
jgi:hypothetical protein